MEDSTPYQGEGHINKRQHRPGQGLKPTIVALGIIEEPVQDDQNWRNKMQGKVLDPPELLGCRRRHQQDQLDEEGQENGRCHCPLDTGQASRWRRAPQH